MEAQSLALENLIADVDACIVKAEDAHFRETAALLRMAKIDLITRGNGVTEEELELFLFTLEAEMRLAQHFNPPERQARGKSSDSDH